MYKTQFTPKLERGESLRGFSFNRNHPTDQHRRPRHGMRRHIGDNLSAGKPSQLAENILAMAERKK